MQPLRSDILLYKNMANLMTFLDVSGAYGNGYSDTILVKFFSKCLVKSHVIWKVVAFESFDGDVHDDSQYLMFPNGYKSAHC